MKPGFLGQSKLLRDPAAAWDTCVRMFDMLYEPRMHVRFSARPGWASSRDECDVFTMDDSIETGPHEMSYWSTHPVPGP